MADFDKLFSRLFLGRAIEFPFCVVDIVLGPFRFFCCLLSSFSRMDPQGDGQSDVLCGQRKEKPSNGGYIWLLNSQFGSSAYSRDGTLASTSLSLLCVCLVPVAVPVSLCASVRRWCVHACERSEGREGKCVGVFVCRV